MVHYRPAALSDGAEQVSSIEAIVSKLQAAGGAEQAIEQLEEAKKALQKVIAACEVSAVFSARVSETDERALRFKESSVADLIKKMKDKVEGGASTAVLQQVRTNATELIKALQELADQQSSAFKGSAEIDKYLDANFGAMQAIDNGPGLGATGEGGVPVAKPMGVGTVVHAAGILSDGLLIPNAGQLAEKFSKVFAAKAHGAWHIHQAASVL
mmetsp:Transcript_27468/g.63497  ORF Transcript_27468/g.63497 Transcript_27468/m.63497 type:complete len:213 (+) Transcript_27468:66-704(+)